jgi:stage III sporulation protein SpoIIIAA
MIMDLLLGTDKNILFLGEPGSGKTTIVREAARILAERKAVMLIDTSNEIAGDGSVPHPCIGDARRMMVPSLEDQHRVMIECVQNHTPQIMIVDEIGRPKEVAAVRTVKQRGVRVVGSAHGSLESLIRWGTTPLIDVGESCLC